VITRETAPLSWKKVLKATRRSEFASRRTEASEDLRVDSDKGFVRVGGLNGEGGIKPSGCAGERRRALRGGGLKDVHNFNSGGTTRVCLRLGFTCAPGGVLSDGLIKV